LGFPTKILYTFLSFLMCVTYPAHLILLHCILAITLSNVCDITNI
jgi:hypothetical protein